MSAGERAEPWQTFVKCRMVMARGTISGRIITCGVCEWCRSDAFDDVKAMAEAQRSGGLR